MWDDEQKTGQKGRTATVGIILSLWCLLRWVLYSWELFHFCCLQNAMECKFTHELRFNCQEFFSELFLKSRFWMKDLNLLLKFATWGFWIFVSRLQNIIHTSYWYCQYELDITSVDGVIETKDIGKIRVRWYWYCWCDWDETTNVFNICYSDIKTPWLMLVMSFQMLICLVRQITFILHIK